jgi:aminoglycoside phosphotransferase (APT) family kinase protein
MSKMHENELNIDVQLVYELLKNQCPHWAKLPLKTIMSSGTDNALFRLGSKYVVRLPRLDGATENINKECEWLPKIAPFLKKPISEPVFKGQPDKSYPFLWTVTKWNKGNNPHFEQEKEYELLAKDLAIFLNEFHAMKLPNGPFSRRGVPLNKPALDMETRKAIGELETEINIQSVTSLWDKLSNIPYWPNEPVWIHGDLLPGNILVQNNRLCAVIDFSDVGIGDPACDLVIAWCLFNARSRNIFRENLVNIDNNTWERSRGWALSIALILLPYYKISNPVLATLARQMIKNIHDN